MAISWKTETDPLREKIFNELITFVADNYDDVMQVESNQFCFPLVGEAGTECFARVTVSIPKGSKDEPYDGYALAQDYVMQTEEKKRKAEERKKEKEAKKKKDAEMRAKREEIAKNNGR